MSSRAIFFTALLFSALSSPCAAAPQNCDRLNDLGREAVELCRRAHVVSPRPRMSVGLDSARHKQEAIFYEKIVPSAYTTLPDLSRGLLLGLENSAKRLLGLEERSGEDFSSSRASGDERPADQRGPKSMNTYGTAALFEFVADAGSPYTGLLQGGSGVLRFSSMGPPGLVGNVPGLALKFLVDGKPSRDMVVMNGFAGQGGSTNVFLKPMSNALPPPESRLMKGIVAIMAKAAKGDPLRQDVGRLAGVGSDGAGVDKPVVPYQIFFEPTHQDGIPADTANDFRKDLAGVKPGTAIYEVTAIAAPGSPKVRIGRLVTRSSFVASEYGDTTLLFKH